MHSDYSIYLHIPFCRHRCAYCDFNTYANLESLIPDYVRALCAEIEWSARSAGERLPVGTVFFGGGTPSLLNAAQVESILESVRRGFQVHPDVETTLEANPGTLSKAHLLDLRRLGVNRLSLGMQSAHPEELRLLEREHGYADVVRAVVWARQAGFEQINLDLIYGLPNQDLSTWQHSLARAVGLRPDHLSLYALSLEHGTPMRHWVERGLLSQPDDDRAADMYEWVGDYLAGRGYEQYEISNWARVDSDGELFSCRHNLQYWHGDPYLGFGAGAHGYAAGVRTANVRAPESYIRRLLSDNGREDAPAEFPHTPATIEATRIEREQSMGEFMMMGLRLTGEGVRNEEFIQRFETGLEDIYGESIQRLVSEGLLEWVAGDTGRLRITKRGRLLANRVFVEFL
jgi:oxygen-independent coproporphyrinogen-3 oxidase